MSEKTTCGEHCSEHRKETVGWIRRFQSEKSAREKAEAALADYKNLSMREGVIKELDGKLAAKDARISEIEAKLVAEHEIALKRHRENMKLAERNVFLSRKPAAQSQEKP